jgi:hypothetical protein
MLDSQPNINMTLCLYIGWLSNQINPKGLVLHIITSAERDPLLIIGTTVLILEYLSQIGMAGGVQIS